MAIGLCSGNGWDALSCRHKLNSITKEEKSGRTTAALKLEAVISVGELWEPPES